MRKIFSIFALAFSFLLVAGLAFAQDVLPVPIPEVSNAEFFESLLAAIGGAKGASTLAIVSLVLQVLWKLLGTQLIAIPWSKLKPQVKFLVVGVLSIASLTVAQMIAASVPLGMALLHSTVVTSLMNYGYKYYELYIEKKS